MSAGLLPKEFWSSMHPKSIYITEGQTVAYSETGLEVARWNRELSIAEADSYLRNPTQMWSAAKQE